MLQYQYTGKQGKWSVIFHSPSELASELFLYIDNAGIYECSPQYLLERKNYYSYLILVTRSGKGTLEMHGNTYVLDEKHILFINTYEWHKYYTAADVDKWEIAWVHFDGLLAEKYLRHIHTIVGPVIYVNKSQALLEKIDKLLELKQKDSTNFEPHASTLLTHMLNILLINAKEADDNTHAYKHEIDQAINYIKLNYTKNLHVSDISKAVHLSNSHFTRMFKKHLGYSPYEYLIKYRLLISKHELCRTDKPVSQIARDIGFSSTSNFISTFKRYEGITPQHYRNNNLR